MSSAARSALVSLAACGLAACAEPGGPDTADLQPYPNRFAEWTDLAEPQPHRDNPAAVIVSTDGGVVYVALQGSVDEPGNEVVAVSTAERRIVERYRVGSSPTALALHPDGRLLVVANRFSSYLSVVDLRDGSAQRVPTDPYAVGLAFSPDGSALFVSNSWSDSVERWEVRANGGRLGVGNVARASVAANPRDVVVDPEGGRVLVASIGGLAVSVFDAVSLEPRAVLDLGAPANGVAVAGDRVYVATTSASTHHPALAGPDTDGDGVPGDGTPNVGFQDLQNELAVFDRSDLRAVQRYTSDTICCFDWRDVSPDDPVLGGLLPGADRWIVGGALPERIAVAERGGRPGILVVYSGSNEVQWFARTEHGLEPGPKVTTGFQPVAIAVAPDLGEAYVADRLGETLTVIDIESMAVVATVEVGDLGGGAFPATDAEIGELYFFAGAAFSVDGDQTCNHCHRERGNIGKAFSMPLLADARGTRMTPSSRGMLETRPWFFEGAMDENNFFPVINEFARPENFCCHDRRDRPGCATDPPAECDARPYPTSLPTRDAFFLSTAERLLGRRRSFGGALDTRLDYMGLTRLLGLFLLHEPALLPNPNPPESDDPDAARGRRIFESPRQGCAGCHPEPAFTVSYETNPFDVPQHSGPVVTPNRVSDGSGGSVNLDLVQPGFLATFPMARQDAADVFLNAPTLVGLWDRVPGFLHDGRARSLREALCTPGHSALEPGEVGYNELDGIPDSHGGTSSLDAGDMADLVRFLLTL